jgi:predicted enzyme related to lactoylglutathione lyase
MRRFYETVFGWKTEQMGPELGEYVLVETTETDDQRMIKTPGNINGGFFQRTSPGEHPRITIAVGDVRSAMKAVRDAGGQVLPGMANPDEPDEIPGVGLFANIVDTEGNQVGLLQPTNM